MTSPETPEEPPADLPHRDDHSHWNWLLLVPIVIPLCTPLFNHDTPKLLDFPLFYWLQLGFVLLGVGCTAIVYNKTKRRD
ncbi:DUF3311 domain-containing protein [Kineosporia succinea]|uniref:DUF3311 domain-containing protein n=1 Tax=Kineosporia succinea TaxID=84632 RepID=A0ABT9P0A8_9ACTN|nr:DUF3311 domain-containing protein [Kineosporia succinea]MDP9825854.1 hypothetical protein [Kineosporia succinea]